MEIDCIFVRILVAMACNWTNETTVGVSLCQWYVNGVQCRSKASEPARARIAELAKNGLGFLTVLSMERVEYRCIFVLMKLPVMMESPTTCAVRSCNLPVVVESALVRFAKTTEVDNWMFPDSAVGLPLSAVE